MEPPASAVINKRVEFGNRDLPIVFHHERMALTANSAVSATSPTVTQPSLLVSS